MWDGHGGDMRYEVMRLMQFLFSLFLIVMAFGAGALVGWYRWAPRSATRRNDRDQDDRSGNDHSWNDADPWSSSAGAPGTAPRSTLFAPVGEHLPESVVGRRVHRDPVGPQVLLAADEVFDLDGRPVARAELAPVAPEITGSR